jgi:dolichol-phosphate mannosyltransferase
LVSVITPAFCEQENLPVLYQRLRLVLTGRDLDWEWIIVDDHSPDCTFAVARTLAEADPRVRVFRFARNCGPHAAIFCGLRQARGDVAALIAADLQDSPETLPAMLAKWRNGAAVVWAVREVRHGDSWTTVAASRLYFWAVRHVVGLKAMPLAGTGFFIADRALIETVKEFGERNLSIHLLLFSIGFRQEFVPYERPARLHGSSGWSLAKKLKLLVDSVTGFSYMPIRFMSWVGILTAVIGFIYALVVAVNALVGQPVPGWASLIVIVLVLGGLQMIMLGVLGEYIWRNLDETRRRPLYFIEDRIDNAPPAANRPPTGLSSG